MQYYLWIILALPLICKAAAVTEKSEHIPLGKRALLKGISTSSSVDDFHSVSPKTGSSGTGSSPESDDEDDPCAIDLRTKAYDLLKKGKVKKAGELFVKSYLLEREECVSDASYAYLNSYDPGIIKKLNKPKAELTNKDIAEAVALFIKIYTEKK